MKGFASDDFDVLQKNPYPGRFFVIGLNEAGEVVIIYGLTGRSSFSRNRRIEQEGTRCFTEIADMPQFKSDLAKKLKIEVDQVTEDHIRTETELTLYTALNEYGGRHVVSNGNQTNTVMDTLVTGTPGVPSLSSMLRSRTFEPDDSHTSRITGMWTRHTRRIEMCVLEYYLGTRLSILLEPEIPPPGFGYLISTYSGDGNPLPAFTARPLVMPLQGDGSTLLETYWAALNPDNVVSLVVRVIPNDGREMETHVHNKYPKVR